MRQPSLFCSIIVTASSENVNPFFLNFRIFFPCPGQNIAILRKRERRCHHMKEQNNNQRENRQQNQQNNQQENNRKQNQQNNQQENRKNNSNR